MMEIICSGIGGQGVLVAGMILADIAMEDGKNVSWYPSYGFEMRGGAANCELKIGDEDLQSPYCLEPDILLTMSESAIDTFEERLKPGGTLLVNSSLVSEDRKYTRYCGPRGLLWLPVFFKRTSLRACPWLVGAAFTLQGVAVRSVMRRRRGC